MHSTKLLLALSAVKKTHYALVFVTICLNYLIMSFACVASPRPNTDMSTFSGKQDVIGGFE